MTFLLFNKTSFSYLGIPKGATTSGAHVPRQPSTFDGVLKYSLVNSEFHLGNQSALSPSLRSHIVLLPRS